METKNKQTKQIETRQELDEHWKDCFIVGIRRKNLSKKYLIEGFELGIKVFRRTPCSEETINVLKAMDGTETWTNAFGDRFGERVCVLVEGNECWTNGEKFKPTKKEVEDLWEDHLEHELGSKSQREADLEAEFGHLTRGTPEENREAFKKEFGSYPEEEEK